MKGHARHLMTEPVTSFGPEDTLADMSRTFIAAGFSGAPVVDEDLQVVGFVSETDLLKALLGGGLGEEVTAGELMSRPPIVVDEFLPSDQVMNILRDKRIHHLPVVRQGKLIGMITPHDVVRYFVEKIMAPPQETA